MADLTALYVSSGNHMFSLRISQNTNKLMAYVSVILKRFQWHLCEFISCIDLQNHHSNINSNHAEHRQVKGMTG